MNAAFRWFVGAAVTAWAVAPICVQATPWTPIQWQDRGKLRNSSRDRNNNFIDDQIEKQTGEVNVIVDLNRCAGDPAVSEIIAYLKTQGDVSYVGKYLTFVIVTGVKSQSCHDIASRPEAAMVELDLPIAWLDTDRQAMKVENSTLYPDNLSKLPAPWQWPSQLDGRNVNIAIVDTGVNENISELQGAWTGFGLDAMARKIVNPDYSVMPGLPFGHGTEMAKFALGRVGQGADAGIAPGAGLIDAKVGDPNAKFSDLLWALDTLIENRQNWDVRVVNLSGGPYPTGAYPQGPPYDGSDCVSQAVNRVAAEGIVVVAACAPQKDAKGNRIPGILPPGAASRAITVGVADAGLNPPNRLNYAIGADSGTGPRAHPPNGDYLDDMKPEIVAPGYVSASAATARTSGLSALLLQMDPNLNPSSLKDLLIRTAEPMGSPTQNADYKIKYPDPNAFTWNEQWGFGFVDAYKAAKVLYQARTADLTFKSFPPNESVAHPSNDPNIPWYFSPAIQVTDKKSGQLTDALKVGESVQISARIWNRPRPDLGPGKTAENARVHFAFYWYTAGANVKGVWDFPRYYPIQSVTVPAIALDQNQTVTVDWTPQDIPKELTGIDPAHGCIFVDIAYGFDIDFSNMSNFAQRNVQVRSTGSPAQFSFRLENPLTQEATIKLNVSHNRPGWKVKLSQSAFTMKPETCPRIVQAAVTPPPGVKPGTEALFFVTPVATPRGGAPVELSGVVMKAVVPEPGLAKSDGTDNPSPPANGIGGVFGRVLALDADGGYLGVIPRATLEFTNEAGEPSRFFSDAEGRFQADLKPGAYAYKIHAQGHKAETSRPDAPLQVREGYIGYNFALTNKNYPQPTAIARAGSSRRPGRLCPHHSPAATAPPPSDESRCCWNEPLAEFLVPTAATRLYHSDQLAAANRWPSSNYRGAFLAG